MAGADSKYNEWMDITLPLRNGMVHWPGDPAFVFARISDMDKGADLNVSHISLTTHCGSHIDAPLHFIKNGMSIDQMPLTATIGQARVIEITDLEAIRADELRPHHIAAGERILFKTLNSGQYIHRDEFSQEYVHLTEDAALYLAGQGVMTVGVDYLSVGGYKKDGREVHRILLGRGVWIIEGLDLSEVTPGMYELVCLPLKIQGGDGAPVRAVIRCL